MRPTLTGVVSGMALFLVVPTGVATAYLGYVRGLYPYAAIPFVVAGLLVVAYGGLLVMLSRLRARGR